MIREHIARAVRDAAAEYGEDDVDFGPAQVLRAVAAGLGRAHVTEVNVDQLTWIADELSDVPQPREPR